MNLRKTSIPFLMILSTAGAAIGQEAGMVRPTGPGGPGASYSAMACQADQHVEGQLAFIKAELGITQEQEPAWNVFAETFRNDKQKKLSDCLSAHAQTHKVSSENLIDSMKVMETRLSEQLDSLRAMEAAIRPLYGALSSEQKRIADEILKGPGM